MIYWLPLVQCAQFLSCTYIVTDNDLGAMPSADKAMAHKCEGSTKLEHHRATQEDCFAIWLHQWAVHFHIDWGLKKTKWVSEKQMLSSWAPRFQNVAFSNHKQFHKIVWHIKYTLFLTLIGGCSLGHLNGRQGWHLLSDLDFRHDRKGEGLWRSKRQKTTCAESPLEISSFND